MWMIKFQAFRLHLQSINIKYVGKDRTLQQISSVFLEDSIFVFVGKKTDE